MLFNLSYNWLKEYLKVNDKPEELAKKLSLHSATVEKIRSLAKEWDKIVVGEVKKIEPHPKADKLKIVLTNVGRCQLRIVCGGTNLRVGMKAAVALLGAKVKWHGQGDPVELQSAEIRGVKSEGMICSPAEIGLEALFPPKDERELADLSSFSAKPGTPLAQALELDDFIMETEITSNRPDLMSVAGLAREAGAVMNSELLRQRRTNSEIISNPKLKTKNLKLDNLTVKVLDKKLCPRYQVAMIEGVQIKESPWWLKKRLWLAGIRPINNIVDITNYVMLELGQPMHAFDADRLQTTDYRLQPTRKSVVRSPSTLIIRQAKEGEKILALDGREYKLKEGMLVIADEKKPVAIAGVMGGEETAVTAKTKTIIFESANFDPISVRRTSRALNLYSDSQLRFEKCLSTESTEVALLRALALTLEMAGGKVASPIIDVRASKYQAKKYSLSWQEISKFIGIEIPQNQIKSILKSLGFRLQVIGHRLQVVVPWWRDHDIEDSRDLVEEVARIYGYHRLPGILPEGEIPIDKKSPELIWEDKLKTIFEGAGLTEIFTYSLVSRTILEKFNLNTKQGLKLLNPLSEEFEYLRPSLIPGLLAMIKENQERAAAGQVFEISKVYQPEKNNLPKEESWVAAAVWGESKEGQEFFIAKGLLEHLAKIFGFDFEIQRAEKSELYHRGRATKIVVKGRPFGLLAEVHPQILARFKIEKRVAILYFSLSDFIKVAKECKPLKFWSAFPAVKRDLAFTIDKRQEYEKIAEMLAGFDSLLAKAELFDIYTGQGIAPEKKSLAFHISYQSAERTLTAEEVEAVHQKLIKKLEGMGAEVRK